MYITNLKLKNFRNYKSLEIDLSKRLNIIYGNNGQGKTNIIESVYLCASGRSHRTNRDSDLINLNEKNSYVGLKLFKENSSILIEILLNREDKKKIKLNEIAVKKVGHLMGNLNAVIFSPEDLMIIKEGPSERRRFLDITISQLKPSYFYDLQQYSKILTQRNALIKEAQYKKSVLQTIEVWNHNLSLYGARIMKIRNAFLKRLSSYSEINQFKLTDGKEKLYIKYTPSVKTDNFEEIEKIQKSFLLKLENSLDRELAKGTTLYGPQRDDFDIFLDDINLKIYGSQGQQRTAVLSLKLSEIDIMKDETGEYPVLLLDDVMSELDHTRQEYLFKSLDNIQTLITCTDKCFFIDKVPEDTLFLKIGDGNIIEKSLICI